jgi:hypothetical protein
MASAVRKIDQRISEEAYFELEKKTDTRHEFIDGYICHGRREFQSWNTDR